MSLGELWNSVEEKFVNAEIDGSLIFQGDGAQHESILETSESSTYEFQLTVLPNLQHRPESGTIKKNPFAKPEPELTIVNSFGESDEFRLLLNKFPVSRNHFMMVTKAFKSQNTPLTPPELLATYQIIDALKTQDKKSRWFAFYNCGPNSGASQPHKHVQFLTLPEGKVDFNLEVARDTEFCTPDQNHEPLQDPSLPYANFLVPLPERHGVDAEVLAMLFASLLQRTLTTLQKNQIEAISYNFCLTPQYMMMIPRSQGKFDDVIGINSCGYMGMILCKDHVVYEGVKQSGILNVLHTVGCPSQYGKPSTEYDY